jgi:hypothetical protein
MFRFMIEFVTWFTMGTAHRWGTFLNYGAKLYCLILGHLFCEWSHPRGLLYTLMFEVTDYVIFLITLYDIIF